MRIIWSFLAGASLTFGGAQSSWADACELLSMEEALEACDLVFTGRVIRTEREYQEAYEVSWQRHSFQVHEVWRGAEAVDENGLVHLVAEGPLDDGCLRAFEVGRALLVYARQAELADGSQACTMGRNTRVASADPADPDLAQLGDPVVSLRPRLEPVHGDFIGWWEVYGDPVPGEGPGFWPRFGICLRTDGRFFSYNQSDPDAGNPAGKSRPPCEYGCYTAVGNALTVTILESDVSPGRVGLTFTTEFSGDPNMNPDVTFTNASMLTAGWYEEEVLTIGLAPTSVAPASWGRVKARY